MNTDSALDDRPASANVEISSGNERWIPDTRSIVFIKVIRLLCLTSQTLPDNEADVCEIDRWFISLAKKKRKKKSARQNSLRLPANTRTSSYSFSAGL